MSTMIDKFMSVDEAAVVIQVTPGRVRQMLRAKVLPGKKLHGMAWLIDKKDVQRLADNRPKPGRPAKSR
jgi:excisionase family DNA binding protein